MYWDIFSMRKHIHYNVWTNSSWLHRLSIAYYYSDSGKSDVRKFVKVVKCIAEKTALAKVVWVHITMFIKLWDACSFMGPLIFMTNQWQAAIFHCHSLECSFDFVIYVFTCSGRRILTKFLALATFCFVKRPSPYYIVMDIIVTFASR